MLFYDFLIVNKSHMKTKNNNVSVYLSVLDFAKMSVALSSKSTDIEDWRKILKQLKNL